MTLASRIRKARSANQKWMLDTTLNTLAPSHEADLKVPAPIGSVWNVFGMLNKTGEHRKGKFSKLSATSRLSRCQLTFKMC